MKGVVAYFSAEFGIHESLPIYSGGLGILAGDFLKAAGDMSIPLVGVGILYRRGYFEQRINQDGRQEALYPAIYPWDLPITPVTDQNGEPLLITVPIDMRQVHLRIWSVQIKSTVVYLMDADVEDNDVNDRRLTDSLYGGSQETRISQEIILGIGGVRTLRALNIRPQVWHMNEGHAALLVLERMCLYARQGMSLDTCLEIVKSNTLFTTHTPVPAGHDVFSRDLIRKYLYPLCQEQPANLEKIFELGRVGEQFNLTRFAVRTASVINGVSKLHRRETQKLLHDWLPEIPAQDVPVRVITNGVHTASWLSPELKGIYDARLPDWSSRLLDFPFWAEVESVPDAVLWQAHLQAKERMLSALGLQVPKESLIIGFARRFASYKRASLIFHDLNRLSQIVNNGARPVYIVFSGKAHPADTAGQELIRRIIEISRSASFEHKVLFVENYNITIAKLMVQGSDLWLNTPLKPLEASGTSGQKAAINGVLNCGILDGWWNEGYNGVNGWAIDPGNNLKLDRDWLDSQCLYQLLEEEIVPMYYAKNMLGYSPEWVKRMKESIVSLTSAYSTARMLREYLDYFYLPLAERGRRFSSNAYEIAQRVASYKQFMRTHWHQVEVQSIELTVEGKNNLLVKSRIQLGEIWYQDIKVEAVGSNGYGGIWKYELHLSNTLDSGIYEYVTEYPDSLEKWNCSDPNIRVFPISPDFTNDFELELTRWGKKQWR